MAARQPPGPPPPPVVQRVRVRYAVRGRLRFTSHRDVARVVERAVRRAQLPIAFSAGFSPHPKISWLGATPTGVASEAEYVEFGLAERVTPRDLAVRLDAALPPGLDVVEAVEAGPGALAERMQASVWELRLPGTDHDALVAAVGALLRADTVMVTRRTKDGSRELDARAALLSAIVSDPDPDPDPERDPDRDPGADGDPDRNPDGDPDRNTSSVDLTLPAADGPCAILRVVVRHTTPVVRPDDVLAALRVVAPLELDAPMVAMRLAQGPLHIDGGDGAAAYVSDPLVPDRAAGVGVDTRSGPA